MERSKISVHEEAMSKGMVSFFSFHGQRFRTFVLSPIFVRNFLSGLMFGCSNYRKVFTAQCDLLLFSSTQSWDKHISPS